MMTTRREKKPRPATSKSKAAPRPRVETTPPSPETASANGPSRFAALEKVGQHSSDLIVVIDGEGIVLYANPVALELFGRTFEEGVGSNAFMYLHPDDVERVSQRMVDLLQTPGGSISDTIKSVTASGEVRQLEVVSTNCLDNDEVAGIIINGRDVTEHLQYVDQLRAHEERFRLAFEDNMAPMICTDLEDLIIAANDAFCHMVGFSREELLGHDSKMFTFPEDVGITEESHRRATTGDAGPARYTKRYLRKDGRVIFVEVSRSPARDAQGKTMYFIISERDITEERALTARLSHQALHDPLSGLANRALFLDRLAQAHARIVRQGGLAAVLLLDLDDFKGVNDTHGHLVGDQLLVAIARRLELVARTSDTLCRFGGDEFLYLADGLASYEEANQIALRLLEALAEPFAVAGVRIGQHASIGVVVWDAERSDFAEIIQDADVALYEAKRQGKGHHVIFTQGMHQQAVSHFAIVQDLRHALKAGQVSMHYQPIVELDVTGIVGFEALMRWQHPERGAVPPSAFIELAEQSSLILELGIFALHEAVAAARTWPGTGPDHVRPYVTVNLSPYQFRDPGLVSMIKQELDESGIEPERLIIEITESATLNYVAETLAVMEELSQLGIGFALDDFGTGYSSLSYLALMRPRIIKIDRSFVSPELETIRNDTLLEAIVALGHNLDMTMLAEGIETKAQLQRLQRLGCELGQGFLFSHAVPASEVPAMLARFPGSWESAG
jgi:diguanylate cyclase (GGDEF)-like protein/PAS domain S-box-containing protein